MAAAFLSTAHDALADEADSDAAQRLPEVQVRGEAERATAPVEGYLAGRQLSATKTDTPLLETPQAVTVVTRERIEDQGATTIQDALNYAAGVRSDAYGLDSRTDSFKVRGSEPAEYRDGLRRQLGGFYTSTARVDPYLLERIEVLRGPASMLYGQGSTAGVINMVSKRPLAESYREIGVRYGSYDRKQVQADLTGPITEAEDWLYRVIALARDADTQTDFVPDDRRLFAPSLTWRPNGVTSLTFQALWQDDHTGSTLQFLPWSGTVLPNPNGQIPTSRFVGEPGFDRYDSERFEAGWLFEHRIGERSALRQNVRFVRNEVDYQTLYPDVYTNPNAPFVDGAQRVLDRFAWVDKRKVRSVAADQHLELNLAAGAVRHQVLVGLDYMRHREDALTAVDVPISQGGGVPPIDVYDPVYTGYTPPPLTEEPRTTLRQIGMYLQDQMTLGRHWIVVAGVRRDQSENRVEGAADETDRATTKRAGIMYLFDSGYAPYLSYSESFSPVAGLDAFGNRFRPLRGEQVEIGLKHESPGGRFAWTAAVYRLEEKNRLVPATPPLTGSVQTGRTENRGVELEAVGRLFPWLDIAAHYNYIDIDSQLEIVPKHQAAIWGTGRFALAGISGFRAGLGVRWMSAFKDGPAPETPAQTLIDGMFGLDDGNWRYALHVQNLTDETYASTCLARGDCFYGARRNVILSASYRY